MKNLSFYVKIIDKTESCSSWAVKIWENSRLKVENSWEKRRKIDRKTNVWENIRFSDIQKWWKIKFSIVVGFVVLRKGNQLIFNEKWSEVIPFDSSILRSIHVWFMHSIHSQEWREEE